MKLSLSLPLFTSVLILHALPAPAQTPAPVGSEFQVQTHTTASIFYPASAVRTDGGFVVVWSSSSSPGDDNSEASIQARLLDSAGSPIGSQFQVNSTTTLTQYEPEVAALPAGGFVVVWSSRTSDGSDTSYTSIQAQRFDGTGTEVGGQFQVNTFTTSYQRRPVVASSDDGTFVVVWSSEYSYSDTNYSIQGQRFDSSGTPLAGQFQINAIVSNAQDFPAVDAAGDGRFVVTWHSFSSLGTDTGSLSVQARLFTSGGAPLAPDQQVNTYTTSTQGLPDVTQRDDGSFVVVWDSQGSSGDDSDVTSVQAQGFDSSGMPVGGELQINTTTAGSQRDPAVSGAADGSFTVLWVSQSDTIQGQRVLVDGTFSGAEFELATVSPGFVESPTLGMDAAGDFLAAWKKGTGDDVLGRRYRITGDVGDFVWHDLDGDGAQDPGEPGLEGVAVELRDDLALLVDSTLTDGSGLYGFSQVPPGDYFIDVQLPNTYDLFTVEDATNDADDSDVDASGESVTFAVEPAVSDDTWDAGVLLQQLGDRVWLDADGDGGQEIGELGLEGLEVELFTSEGVSQGTATTDVDGLYSFSEIAPGTYYLSFEKPFGYEFTTPFQTTSELDSDVDPSTGRTPDFVVAAGAKDLSRDAGLVELPISDLSVSLASSSAVYTPGESIVYTLIAANLGPDAAADVLLGNTLPMSLTCTWEAVGSNGATGFSPSGIGAISDTLQLPSTGTVDYTITCDIDPSAVGSLTHTASISADVADAEPANDVAEEMDSLVPSTDLSLSKSAPGNAEAGGFVEFSLAVTNGGPSASTGATVTDSLPAGLTFSSSADCSHDGGTVTCAIGALAPGEQALASFLVAIDGALPVDTMITNSASVAADESDPAAGNDTDGATVTLVVPDVFADGFESGDTSAWSVTVN